MLKTMLLVERREGSTSDELSEHYQEVHAPLGLPALPTLRRHMRNFVDPPNSESFFGVITECCFDDLEGRVAAGRFYAAKTGNVPMEYEASSMDRDSMVSLILDERESTMGLA